jgi:hypothetical protein
VNISDALGLLQSTVEVLTEVGLAGMMWMDIKIFATNLGMVWGEVETEMESKRGAHFLPGLRMRVE